MHMDNPVFEIMVIIPRDASNNISVRAVEECTGKKDLGIAECHLVPVADRVHGREAGPFNI